MKLSLIAAVDEDWGIGKNNQVPWRLSHDLKRFKQITLGHHLLMGRKTYESIGYPLPGRISIVITRQKAFPRPAQFNGKLHIAAALSDGIQLAESYDEKELFIIGGGQIYAQALSLADCIYLTRVHTRCCCDTFFPTLNPEEWLETHYEPYPADEKNEYATTFTILHRIKPDNQA